CHLTGIPELQQARCRAAIAVPGVAVIADLVCRKPAVTTHRCAFAVPAVAHLHAPANVSVTTLPLDLARVGAPVVEILVAVVASFIINQDSIAAHGETGASFRTHPP